MGCNIAAHLSNVGFNVLLLDQASNQADKNIMIRENLDLFSKLKPNIFFSNDLKDNIEIGNLTDNINDILKCDWIIEAIIENLDIKNKLFIKIDKIILDNKKNIIISSNTSGLSVKKMCQGTSLTFKENFLVTHFFNPVRYLHLLEIVPSEQTLQKNIVLLSDICNRVLGKGVIHAKESPNFIANRIGIYATLKVIKIMLEKNYSVQEIDYILGEQTGRPKSAVFKTLDIVGIDTFSHVSDNCFNSLLSDEEHEIFRKPKFIEQMIEKGLLGRKSKQGFYKKQGKIIEVLDLNTMLYSKKKKIKYDSIEGAKKIDNLMNKLYFILNKDDRASSFIIDITILVCIYASNRIFEISNSLEDIDNSMKWGFNWQKGPFEICDLSGVKDILSFASKNNCKIPTWLLDKNLSKSNHFYITENDIKKVWCPLKNSYISIKNDNKNILDFSIIKNDKNKIIKQLNVTKLIDVGNDVVVCEFNTKLNSIDLEVLSDIEKSLDICEEKNYKGLIIYNEGGNFSVGMNLWLVYMGIQAKQWKQINDISKKFQDLCVRLKYSSIATISAPYNLTLGGGAELSMWCNLIEAHAELYMGLVEVGVGLIPGAGGNIELLSRALTGIPHNNKMPLDIILSKPLEAIAMAKVGTSALECKKYLYLSQQDNVTINKDLHLTSAKLSAMKIINSGFNTYPRRTFFLPGREAFSNFKLMLTGMYNGGFISEHDLKISLKIAYIISGGECNPHFPVKEQTLLDLEREAFLSLCGEKKTFDRLEHMLKTNKPLRN
jgi:3-hydroxyacyl-CoA dehydrogenase